MTHPANSIEREADQKTREERRALGKGRERGYPFWRDWCQRRGNTPAIIGDPIHQVVMMQYSDAVEIASGSYGGGFTDGAFAGGHDRIGLTERQERAFSHVRNVKALIAGYGWNNLRLESLALPFWDAVILAGKSPKDCGELCGGAGKLYLYDQPEKNRAEIAKGLIRCCIEANLVKVE